MSQRFITPTGTRPNSAVVTVQPAPTAAHTLSPLLTDDQVLKIVDHFLTSTLIHPVLRPYYMRIDRHVLRHKLAGFISQLFGGLPYNRRAMKRAHAHMRLDDVHFDSVMEVLERVLDLEDEVNGERLVPWRWKVQAMREAEGMREEVLQSGQGYHDRKVSHDTCITTDPNMVITDALTLHRPNESWVVHYDTIEEWGQALPSVQRQRSQRRPAHSVAMDSGSSSSSGPPIKTKSRVERCVQS
jgi:truncated hemoglobin YjbI